MPSMGHELPLELLRAAPGIVAMLLEQIAGFRVTGPLVEVSATTTSA